MSASVYLGKYVPLFKEDGHNVMPNPVSVCKTPIWPAPVPVPYPNTATSWGTSAANKQAVTVQLKANLESLHRGIGIMCGGANPTEVHKFLDAYADTVIKLYYALAPTAVKVEGNQVVRRFP